MTDATRATDQKLHADMSQEEAWNLVNRSSKDVNRPSREDYPLTQMGDLGFARALAIWQGDEIERLRGQLDTAEQHVKILQSQRTAPETSAPKEVYACPNCANAGCSDCQPEAPQLNEHDAGIIRDLEAMAKEQLAGFWPRALAMGALRLIRQGGAVKTSGDPCPHCGGAGCEYCWGNGQLSSSENGKGEL